MTLSLRQALQEGRATPYEVGTLTLEVRAAKEASFFDQATRDLAHYQRQLGHLSEDALLQSAFEQSLLTNLQTLLGAAAGLLPSATDPLTLIRRVLSRLGGLSGAVMTLRVDKRLALRALRAASAMQVEPNAPEPNLPPLKTDFEILMGQVASGYHAQRLVNLAQLDKAQLEQAFGGLAGHARALTRTQGSGLGRLLADCAQASASIAGDTRLALDAGAYGRFLTLVLTDSERRTREGGGEVRAATKSLRQVETVLGWGARALERGAK